MNKLEQIKQKSIIVIDTGEIDLIKKFSTTDATTNPTLILKAIQLPHYQYFIDSVIKQIRILNIDKDEQASMACDHLAVTIGTEILRHINGFVSTEIDARLSFDIKKMVEKARQIIKYYETLKVPRERILIKIAATWEGIKAAEILKLERINCNMTLIFGITQAMAVANSKLFLISPFVGRILDWYKKNQPQDYTYNNDPGVISVKKIYKLYKNNDIETIVMAASFRSNEQIQSLSGCDRLTISPNFLAELENDKGQLNLSIDDEIEQQIPEYKTLSKEEFRWMLNDNAMSYEKLGEGIRVFASDQIKLENIIKDKLSQL